MRLDIPTIVVAVLIGSAAHADASATERQPDRAPPPMVKSDAEDRAWGQEHLPKGWRAVLAYDDAVVLMSEPRFENHSSITVRFERHERPKQKGVSRGYELYEVEIDCAGGRHMLRDSQGFPGDELMLLPTRDADWRPTARSGEFLRRPIQAACEAAEGRRPASAEGRRYEPPQPASPPPPLQSRETDQAWASSTLPAGWTMVSRSATTVFSIANVSAESAPLVRFELRQDPRDGTAGETHSIYRYEIDCRAATFRLLGNRSWLAEGAMQVGTADQAPEWVAIASGTALRDVADMVCKPSPSTRGS